MFDVASTVSAADIHVICVPTPVDIHKRPDLSLIINALESLMPVLEEDDVIVIESTIYPGLCEEILLPILSRLKFPVHLAHCPERINPGDKKLGIKNIPRVLGSTTDTGLAASYKFYASILDAPIERLNSIKSAEATKILENVFRDVNIALINEMAQAFHRMDIDISEVLRGASSKPFSFLPHFPGVGVGGHCIAVDPYYMIEKGNASGFDHEFLRLARKINESMPIYTVNLLQNTLNRLGLAISAQRVGVYGLSYKPDIADDRESPSYHVISKLEEDKQSRVYKFDPLILHGSDFLTLDAFLSSIDCLIICTAHAQILNVRWKKYDNIKVILDGRNCLIKENLEDSKILYQGIGRS